MGASAPFWRFSAASYPDLEVTMPTRGPLQHAELNGGNDISTGVWACPSFTFFIFGCCGGRGVVPKKE